MSAPSPPPAVPAQAKPTPTWYAPASAVVTVVLFALTLYFGVYYILNPDPVRVSLLLGAAGGIAHEIAQSGGTVLIPRPDAQGDYYLGSLSGAVLGVVAGFLVLRGAVLTSPTTSDMVNLAILALAAGLALKGVADVDGPAKTKDG
jgi:hypothetical protein